MEQCKWNHLFLLNNTQKQIYKYYKNESKPSCHKCGSNSQIIKLIHSNLSKAFNKVALYTNEIKLITNQCGKDKKWMCKKCKFYI